MCIHIYTNICKYTVSPALMVRLARLSLSDRRIAKRTLKEPTTRLSLSDHRNAKRTLKGAFKGAG